MEDYIMESRVKSRVYSETYNLELTETPWQAKLYLLQVRQI